MRQRLAYPSAVFTRSVALSPARARPASGAVTSAPRIGRNPHSRAISRKRTTPYNPSTSVQAIARMPRPAAAAHQAVARTDLKMDEAAGPAHRRMSGAVSNRSKRCENTVAKL